MSVKNLQKLKWKIVLGQREVSYGRVVQQGGDRPRVEVRPRIADQRKRPQRGRGRCPFSLSALGISQVDFSALNQSF